MADDMDDIEDLLEAPYKNLTSAHGNGSGDSSSIKKSTEPGNDESSSIAKTNDVAASLDNGQSNQTVPTDDSNIPQSAADGGDEEKEDGGKTAAEKQNGDSKETNGNENGNDDEKDSTDTGNNDNDANGKSPAENEGETKSETESSKHKDRDSKSSKKSRRDRSRDRSRSVERKHKKRSRSRSRSHSRSKKYKRRSRSRSRDRRRRSRSRDHHRRRSRTRSRSPRRRRSSRSSRSRSRSRKNDKRHSSRSRRSRSRGDRSHSRTPKRARSPEMTPEERDVRTVFCMQLSARIRPRDLEDFFSAVGKVRDVRLITDPRTKRSKGIAYIEFRQVESVPLAIALTGQRLLGVPIIVKLTQAEKNRAPYPPPYHIPANIPPNGPMKLYVGSLHVNITEDMLRGIFEPFGNIDIISLAKDDQQKSKGFGYIQFSHAEDAKKAIEQLNNFELANRPIKVAPFTEKTNYDVSSISHLDNEELDRSGVNLGATGKLALMAKLAEGTGMRLPQHSQEALNVATNTTTSTTAAVSDGAPIGSPLATQCFILTNMFNLEEEKTKPNWKDEIREDIIEECTKYGGIVHLSIDEEAPDGLIYIKCPTIAVAMSAMAGLDGRYFAGQQIKVQYIPIATYNQKFPDSIACTQILKPSL